MKLILGSLTYPLANGVTNSINVTIDGLRAAGHEVVVVAPDYDTGQIRPEHRPVSSSRISELATKTFGNSERFFSVRALGEIQKIVDEFQPDIYWLHTVTWAPNIFEAIMQRNKKVKVLTYHTLVDYYAKIYAGKVGEQHFIGRSKDVCAMMDCVIAPSQFVKNRLLGWQIKTPIEVIPTGIPVSSGGYSATDLKKKYRIPRDHKILLSVGRVVRDKNISALLRTLQTVVKHYPKTTLLLVGPGGLDDFRKEAESLGIGKHVVMTDQVPPTEARKMYWGADVFVFASQSETQGLIFGEAMNAGLPIAALTSPIQPEFYPETVACVGQSESHLASLITDLLVQPKKQATLRIAGRKFFEAELSLKAMTTKQLAVLSQLVGGQ